MRQYENAFTDKDDQALFDHYSTKTPEEIMAMMPGHTWGSIRDHARKLREKAPADVRERFMRRSKPHKPENCAPIAYRLSQEHKEAIERLYPGTEEDLKELRCILSGWSANRIRKAAYRLGVTRSGRLLDDHEIRKEQRYNLEKAASSLKAANGENIGRYASVWHYAERMAA